ncbi:MAG: 2-amino-4-hydroxy-6-hydroxymethyldihydropteridine diphosphokinase [Paracoccaceae bacterium]
MTRTAYLALGANQNSSLGSPRATLSHALIELHEAVERQNESLQLLSVSRFFQSPAFPPGSGPDFVNAVAAVETSLNAEGLLAHLHGVEAWANRVRTGRWQPRTLDLDLLAMGGEIAPDAEELTRWITLPPEKQAKDAPERLILPHPRLQDRAFVLIPMAEIAPLWRHPLTGKTVAEMTEDLSTAAKADLRPI